MARAFDDIAQSVTPEATTIRDHHLVPAATLELMCQPRLTMFIEKLEEMRGDREWLPAAPGNRDDTFRGQESLGLNQYIG